MLVVPLVIFVVLPLAWSARLAFGQARSRLDLWLSRAALAVYVALVALVGPFWTWG